MSQKRLERHVEAVQAGGGTAEKTQLVEDTLQPRSADKVSGKHHETLKFTTPAGINYGIWWLGWRMRGFWFHAFTLDKRKGVCISAGCGLFAFGRGY